LAISLWVVGTTKFELDIQLFEQVLPELASKYFVPVCDDHQWQATKFEDVIQE
jgi:hypothetical protein